MTDRQIYWIGASRKELSSFPKEAKRKAGLQLRAIQRGQKPSDFKPIEGAIYVLYAFQKKTQKTSKRDIELGQKRYQEMVQFRQTKEESSDDG